MPSQLINQDTLSIIMLNSGSRFPLKIMVMDSHLLLDEQLKYGMEDARTSPCLSEELTKNKHLTFF